MKIQIDTTEKIIRIEEIINLGELIKELQLLLPNDLWKEFKIDTQTKILWNDYPITYPEYPDTTPVPIQPYYPYYPWITWTSIDGGTTNNLILNSGTYNVVTDNK